MKVALLSRMAAAVVVVLLALGLQTAPALGQTQTANFDQRGDELEAVVSLVGSPGANVRVEQAGQSNKIAVDIQQAQSAVVGAFLQKDTSNSDIKASITGVTVGGSYTVDQSGGSGHQADLTIVNAANSAVAAKQEGSNQRLAVDVRDSSNVFITPTQRGEANLIDIAANGVTGPTAVTATQDGTNNRFTAALGQTPSNVNLLQEGNNNSVSYTSN